MKNEENNTEKKPKFNDKSKKVTDWSDEKIVESILSDVEKLAFGTLSTLTDLAKYGKERARRAQLVPVGSEVLPLADDFDNDDDLEEFK